MKDYEVISHEYLEMYPVREKRKDGIAITTYWSNAWRNPDNHRKLLFFDNGSWDQAGKVSSFETPIHRARIYMNHLEIENKKWKALAIEAKKELSKLKRQK